MLKLHIQIVCGVLTALILSGFAPRALAEATHVPWILDGSRLCSFDEGVTGMTRCNQYRQVIEHKMTNGEVAPEYKWKWVAGYNEVIYSPVSGIPGISKFTIGHITTLKRGNIVHNREKAVSYSANREEVVIGIPGDGYSFSMEGAL